ncbi:MAG: hypothetical protein SVT52_00245 [Planctomycetota bacterium]|nr:hypothetical protein [Planctomycetota bacterium]
MLRRNDTLDAQPLAQKHMIGLRVVAGVGHQPLDDNAIQRRHHRPPKLVDIRRRTTSGEGRKDTMCAAVADNCKLGVTLAGLSRPADATLAQSGAIAAMPFEAW